MMRLIGRIQIAAATGLAIGLAAVSVRAADSNKSTAVPVQTAPAAETAAPAETLPPGAGTPIPTADLPDPANPPQTIEQPPACEPGPEGRPGFHPLAPLRERLHPLAPMRQRFAETHTAPLLFPRYDGQPQTLALPGIRPAAAYTVAPQSLEQPMSQGAGSVGANGAELVDGSGQPASLEEYGAEGWGTWFGGADYLLIRPHQTYDSAYEISPNGATGPAVQNVNFNPSFGNAVRLFAGFDTSCDESLRFSYTYMFNDTLRAAAVPTGGSILSPLGATLFPGDSIVATEHLLLNAWDLEDVRKLNFAWCNCKDCPRWDANWSWGVRMIQLDESILNSATGPDAGEFTQKSTFVGAGPRLGIDIHRQLGHSRLSAYVAADAALLIGEQRTTGTNTPSGSNGVQALPNFDVQLGLRWQPTCHLSVTGGYLFETFGDATQLSEASSLAILAPPQASSLSYDGFFFRGEFKY